MTAERHLIQIFACCAVLAMSPCISASAGSMEDARQGNGFRYYVQEAAPGRHRMLRSGVEEFTLRGGDCDWQKKGRASKDCRTHRERVEVRSLTVDPVGQTVCYRFDLKLPADYPENTPKQLLGQWHSGKSNVFRNRYENGVFEIAVNYRHHLRDRVRVPFRKARWNSFLYRFNWGTSGSAEAWLNGRKVYDLQNAPLVTWDVRSVYFKYGVYRSDMNRFPGVAPTQSASFRKVARFQGSRCSALR